MEYEYIREKRMEGIKEADQKCQKLHMGKVQFSPKFKALTQKIKLWSAVIKKKKRCTFSQSKLRRLEKAAGISHSLHCSLQKANDRLSVAYSEYWTFKNIAHNERTIFLEEKARAIAKEEGIEKSKVIKQIISREQQREAARCIKYTLHKIRKGGITKVDIETDAGTIQEITTKLGIEQACMSENKFFSTNTDSSYPAVSIFD
jgi:predicted transposase YbfD/YdcC